jgi:adenylate kinase
VRIALLGPPGSGKGTQAAALARHFGVPVISSGELLRGRVDGANGEWRDVAARLAQGDLVPDEVVLDVVNRALRDHPERNGYVLDGFPRTRAQAEHPAAPPLDAVVQLALADDVARKRLAGRAAAGRDDDGNDDAIERRLRHYHAQIEPLLDLYRARGVLTVVDAAQPADGVTTAILAALTTNPD